tara:strand:+ start:590 stop:1045 length:456 start_codon:yes stop_codon:yes gene_type:complete
MRKIDKKFKIIKSITCVGWGLVPKLVAIMDSANIREKEWSDQFQQNHPDMYPLDLSNIKTWSTYEDCVGLTFTFINSKSIECQATVYNGDWLGERTDRRFTATFYLPSSFLPELKREIEYAFDNYCKNEYEDHLRKQKSDWINKFKKTVLA